MIEKVVEYPSSWEVMPLGEFVHSEKGKKPKNLCEQKTDICNIPYIDIKAFEKNIFDKYTDGINCRISKDTDILIVWDGSRSGLVGKGVNGALGSTLARVNFFGLNNNYAYYFLKSKYQEINSRAKGAATPHVDPELLWNYQFPIPPLPEQHRIVEKIETLFSELDNGIENLKTANAQLKQYRQSVLKSAFEGKLTEAWRKEHADELESAESLLERIKVEREEAYEKKIATWKEAVKVWEENAKEGKKPAKPKKLKEITKVTDNELLEMSVIPSNWNFVRMGHLIEEPKYGTSKKSDYDIKGIGVLRIPNIADGVINTDDLKYALFSEEEQNTYDLREGDLLTIRSNGSVGLVGKTAIINKTNEEYLYAGYLIRLRPYETIDSKYLHYVLSSQLLRKQIEQKAKSTSGVNNINSGELESLVIPVAAIEEQHQIVNEIESRLSEADTMGEIIDVNLKKAERLRQSILNKSFEGKLVPQDANDEPASELLERIKKEGK